MAIDIEAIIKEAQERGVFDNLPGAGKPLPEDHFKDLPEEIRMTYRILKSAGMAPTEVVIKKSLEELRARIGEEKDPLKKEKMTVQFNTIEAELNLKLEQLKTSTSGKRD